MLQTVSLPSRDGVRGNLLRTCGGDSFLGVHVNTDIVFDPDSVAFLRVRCRNRDLIAADTMLADAYGFLLMRRR